MLVVVLLAVRLVLDDVEVGRREGLLARSAGKALLVPAACEAAISGFDGFAFDDLVAAATAGLDAAGCWTANGSLTWLGLRAGSLWWHWQWLLGWLR